jgi:hypothetical protein
MNHHLLPEDSPIADWGELEQSLLLACLARANREPNLTHLIAADLSSIGLFNPILTTNFDDMMLAAFWSLPHRTFHIEPHIIYNANASSVSELRKIRRSVPVVIKVHGHHTTYRMARFEAQVHRLIPSVVRLYRQCPRPKYGFIIVGYSGRWDDGVMAILQQKDLVRRKPVYWLFKGSPPELIGPLKKVVSRADVRFVEIDESDELFIQMWERVSDENPYLGDKMLDAVNLFCSIPMSERRAALNVATGQPRWQHGIEYTPGMTNEQYWSLPAMKKLQEHFLPILEQMAELDEKSLEHEIYRFLSQSYKRPTLTRIHTPDEDEYYGIPELELNILSFKLPSGMEWTRRNRAVFRIALEGKIDLPKSIELLDIVQVMSEQARRIEE